MPKFVNRSISILEVGGEAYQPNAEMDLTDAQVKDATVDWWLRSGYIVPASKAGEVAPATSVAFIPTNEEMAAGRTVELVEPGTPVAQETTKAKR